MNDTHKQLQALLQKRMDRKSFLKHVGIGLLVLTGLSGVLKLLHGTGKSGYGSSPYGGNTQSKKI